MSRGLGDVYKRQSLALIVIYMIALYRLLGVVASITLIGQVAGMLAAVSGWFGFMSSTTLTIPGIAGIILSIGMAVDANVIIFTRIKDERAQLEERIKELQQQQKNPISQTERAKDLVQRYLDTAYANRELLVSLIERIELTAAREIIVKFRFAELQQTG